MQIICLDYNSQEMSSLIFSEKTPKTFEYYLQQF